ncbi:hypothetical protein EDF74_3333 [Stenotrophomonas rhizophila]|nr:hypothetical protein EDF74_3333 [Stenotrophomonas rhizophila]
MHDGWDYRAGRWDLGWVNRSVAVVVLQPDGSAKMTLCALKIWQVIHMRAASVDQDKRYAERWCAARLFPEVSTREGVERFR